MQRCSECETNEGQKATIKCSERHPSSTLQACKMPAGSPQDLAWTTERASGVASRQPARASRQARPSERATRALEPENRGSEERGSRLQRWESASRRPPGGVRASQREQHSTSGGCDGSSRVGLGVYSRVVAANSAALVSFHSWVKVSVRGIESMCQCAGTINLQNVLGR